MSTIHVTANGLVHVGRNEWVSLDRIQAAVHNKQHPNLNNEGREGQMQKSMHANCDQCPQQHSCTHQQIANEFDPNEECLPLPSTYRKTEQRNTFQQKSKLQTTNERGEAHLPLPSTLRR